MMHQRVIFHFFVVLRKIGVAFLFGQSQTADILFVLSICAKQYDFPPLQNIVPYFVSGSDMISDTQVVPSRVNRIHGHKLFELFFINKGRMFANFLQNSLRSEYGLVGGTT